MSRSSWKGPFVNINLDNSHNNKLAIKTKSRSTSIVPNFVGQTFQVHNGHNYVKVIINEDMIGYKLGEFSPTRKTFIFKKKFKK